MTRARCGILRQRSHQYIAQENRLNSLVYWYQHAGTSYLVPRTRYQVQGTCTMYPVCIANRMCVCRALRVCLFGLIRTCSSSTCTYEYIVHSSSTLYIVHRTCTRYEYKVPCTSYYNVRRLVPCTSMYYRAIELPVCGMHQCSPLAAHQHTDRLAL